MSDLCHILNFSTTLPEDPENNHPHGYAVCKLIEQQLAVRGYDVERFDNHNNIAWSTDCIINKKRVYFFVGHLGTQHTDWQLIVCSSATVFHRLFGYKDLEERKQLARAIHEILCVDERFTDLAWCSRYSDTGKDQAHRTPTE